MIYLDLCALRRVNKYLLQIFKGLLMPTTRSARGDFIDFELLAIKAQLAANPVPALVEARRAVIEENEGVKPSALTEMLAVATEAADISLKATPKRK